MARNAQPSWFLADYTHCQCSYIGEPGAIPIRSAIVHSKCMQAAKYRLKANGLHLYPLFFWDWPYAPDKSEKRLRQLERDWIWFAAWFRYAWNPDRDPSAERNYWIDTLGKRFGSREAGKAILDAYEASGECAPKLLRRFGITEGNRQTMSLGMMMSQLTNPERHMPWPDLWESQSPQGERLEEFVVKELSGEPHIGETPTDIIADAQRHAEEALLAIKQASNFVSHNREEYERLASDMVAIRHMVQAYVHKVKAAILILTYKHSVKGEYFNQVELLEAAALELEKGLDSYRELTTLTEKRICLLTLCRPRSGRCRFEEDLIIGTGVHVYLYMKRS